MSFREDQQLAVIDAFNELDNGQKVGIIELLAHNTENPENSSDSYVALTSTYLSNMIANFKPLPTGTNPEKEMEHMDQYITNWLSGNCYS